MATNAGGRVHRPHVRSDQRNAARYAFAVFRKDYDDRRRRQAQGQAKAKAEGDTRGVQKTTGRNEGIAGMLPRANRGAQSRTSRLQPRNNPRRVAKRDRPALERNACSARCGG